MKKLLLVVLIAIFAIASVTMTACGNSGNGEHNGDGEGEGQTIPKMEGFTLEEAYEAGLLTVADLEMLSQFPSNDVLDEKIELAIKTSCADLLSRWRSPYLPFPVEDIVLHSYFGEYHGLYAVGLLTIFPGELGWVFEKDVGGVHFVYEEAPEITVWRVIPDGENGEDEIDGEVSGKVFEFQEAYEKGYITRAVLEQIIYYNNADMFYPRPLNGKVETAIKEAAAEWMRTRERDPIPWAEAKGFTIFGYFGRYSDCHVVIMDNNYELKSTQVPDFWTEIDGIPFHVQGNGIYVFALKNQVR